MHNFIAKFIFVACIIGLIDNVVQYVTDDEIISFTLMYAPTLLYCKNYKYAVWIVLAYLHGLAHIVHPAFENKIHNPDYTPVYDFIVHSCQALTAYYYNKELMPVSVMFHSFILVAGFVSELKAGFMGSMLFILMSSGGIFGTHYHMMLLNTSKKENVYYASLFIWTFLYAGYLYQPWIPEWDFYLNMIGSFRLWFLVFFIVNEIY